MQAQRVAKHFRGEGLQVEASGATTDTKPWSSRAASLGVRVARAAERPGWDRGIPSRDQWPWLRRPESRTIPIWSQRPQPGGFSRSWPVCCPTRATISSLECESMRGGGPLCRWLFTPHSRRHLRLGMQLPVGSTRGWPPQCPGDTRFGWSGIPDRPQLGLSDEYHSPSLDDNEDWFARWFQLLGVLSQWTGAHPGVSGR